MRGVAGVGLVALIAGVSLIGAVGFAGASDALTLQKAGHPSTDPTCPPYVADNMTGFSYYWITYNTSTGAIDAFAQGYVGLGGVVEGQPIPGPNQSVLNISSNQSTVYEMWCDMAEGHGAYWSVDLATHALIRKT
jgi:hypothetical protein